MILSISFMIPCKELTTSGFPVIQWAKKSGGSSIVGSNLKNGMEVKVLVSLFQ